MRARAVGVVLALASVTPLLGCEATARVAVTVTPSGSGSVAVSVLLDRQAAAQVGSAFRLDDLQRAGWAVSPPAVAADGSVTETVRHPFSSAADGTALLRSLVGGPAIRLDVRHSRGIVSSRTGVSGVVDLRGGVASLAGSTTVGGVPLATAVSEMEQAGAVPPGVRVQVAVSLPGRPGSVAGGGRVADDTVVWETRLGQSTVIGAVSSRRSLGVAVWLIGAGILATAAVAITLTEVLRVHPR